MTVCSGHVPFRDDKAADRTRTVRAGDLSFTFEWAPELIHLDKHLKTRPKEVLFSLWLLWLWLLWLCGCVAVAVWLCGCVAVWLCLYLWLWGQAS